MPKKGKEITNPELAILSLMAEQDLYGYQIEQLIEERGMRDWTEIGFSSIYHILNKLEKQGWLKSRLQPTAKQGPTRRVYHLTSTGRKIWQMAALQALSFPKPYAFQFQLGLANLPFLERQLVRDALKQYGKNLENKKIELTRKRDGYGKGIPKHVFAMFDLSLKMLSAEQEWLEEFIKSK